MNRLGPDENWKEEILKIIKLADKKIVSLQDIYAEMRNHAVVTSYHMEPWSPGLQPRYQCWIRRSLTDLVREGRICRVSRGMYSYIRS